jgi:HK97 family phage portal protein
MVMVNKYGAITEEKFFNGIPNLPSRVFMKPLLLINEKADLQRPYEQHVWTYSCIKAKSTALKSVPFIFVKSDKSNAKTLIDKIRSTPVEKLYKKDQVYIKSEGFDIVENGAVYNLFNKPNPFMSKSQLWESYMILVSLTGEVFWALDNNNKPIEMGKLPDSIIPYGASAFNLELDNNKNAIGWKRNKSVGLEEQLYQFNQIIRFYYYNPYSNRGLAPETVTHKSGSQDLKSQVFSEALFDNGALPGGFIKIKEFLDPEKVKQLRSGFEDRHKGPTNAGKIGILQNDADYLPNPNTNSDMQFIEGRKWNRDETFAGHGVPKMKASIYEDLQLATALQADKAFWQDQIIPEARYIEEVINAKIFDGSIKEAQGMYCMFDFSQVEALQTNAGVKSEIAKRYFDMGYGINQINERLGLGFETVAWGDVGYLPAGLVPLSDDMSDSKEDPEETDSDKESDKKTIIRMSNENRKEKILSSWIKNVFKEESVFQSKIKKYWFELRVEQLKTFEAATKAVPSSAELDQILFDNQEWQEKLRKISKPFLYNAAELSIVEASNLLGVKPWTTYDPRVLTILNTKESKISGITDRFWNTLKSNLTDGIRAGETVQELSGRIRQQFNFVSSPARTLTIARTELAQVASPVRHSVLSGEGVTKIEWTTASDENVRDDHTVFGEVGVVKIGHNFMDDVGKMGTLQYPSDMRGPAEQTINCRCVEIPAY